MNLPVRAATLVAPERLEVRDYPYPRVLEPGAVLLRMLASGICGTDKHTFRGEAVQYLGTDHERRTPFPIIQGHENVGVVAEVGPGGARAADGTPLQPGDRVPEALPDEVAVLTEIFAVTHSLERAAVLPRPNGLRPGDAVAVIGGGALGLAHAVKASLMGAGRVCVVEPSARRRALAERIAGAVAVAPSEAAAAADADLVVNATGFPGAFAQALDLVRDGGTVIEVGAFVDMVSHRFALTEAPRAMAVALDADASAKVLITP